MPLTYQRMRSNITPWTRSPVPSSRQSKRLRVIMVHPSLIACCTALQKRIPFQLHELQFSIWCLTSTIFYFPVKHSRDQLCTDFYHQQMLARNGTSAYAHSAVQYVQQHDSFLRRRNSAAQHLRWHMMAHILRKQQPFGWVSALAERSPVSKML